MAPYPFDIFHLLSPNWIFVFFQRMFVLVLPIVHKTENLEGHCGSIGHWRLLKRCLHKETLRQKSTAVRVLLWPGRRWSRSYTRAGTVSSFSLVILSKLCRQVRWSLSHFKNVAGGSANEKEDKSGPSTAPAGLARVPRLPGLVFKQ